MRNINFRVALPVVLIMLGSLITACGSARIGSGDIESTDLPQASSPAPVTTPLVNSQQSTGTVAVPTIAVAATSRGQNLEATDPTTVRLDSGELQLVEFFRFT